MRILGFNISRAGNREVTPADQKTFSPEVAEWVRGEDLDRGGAVLSNAYQQVVWVYRAITVLAEQVANVPFRFSIGQAGGEHLITSGPLPDFYARPHPQINRFQYWELRVMWLMLRGECMRVPIYEAGSEMGRIGRMGPMERAGQRLSQVLILDPSHFQHIVEDHQLIGWRYTGFGAQAPLASQVFLPEEVWFERLPNPFDFRRGQSPLQAAEMAAQTDFAAGAFMRGVIENNGDVGVVARTEQPLSDEQQQQLLAQLRARKRRAGTADRPLVLTGVNEIIKPTLSSSDIQFLENRKFSRGEICAAFGVPEEIVSATDHAKYDVMEGARRNFIENRVAPLCSRLEAEENATIIPALIQSAGVRESSIENRRSKIKNSVVGWFDLDSLPILQNARRERLAAARAGFEMGVPFNELNRVLDLGFKPLPWGDAGYVASKLQRVGEQPHSEIRISKSEGNPKTEIRTALQPETIDDPVSALERAGRFLSQLTDHQPPTTHHPLHRKLSRFLFEQRGRVLARLANSLKRISPISPISPIQHGSPSLFDLAAENETLIACLKSLPADALESGPPGGQLKQINQNTLAALEQALAAAAAAGEEAGQLAARVKTVYNRRLRELRGESQ